MLAHIQNTIDGLKQKVRKNVSIINKNQIAIKEMMAKSGDYSGQFEIYIRINKELLLQNNEMINVQLTLINFIEKYKETAIVQEDKRSVDIYSITDEQEVFDLTIKDKVPFDDKHPHFHNRAFIDKLIVFHKNQENYEYCQELQRLKES